MINKDESYIKLFPDLESAQMMAPEKETLEGGYHLLRCSLSDLAATFWKGEIKLPVQRFDTVHCLELYLTTWSNHCPV